MAEKELRQQVEDIRAVAQLQPAAPNLNVMDTTVSIFPQQIGRGDFDGNPLLKIARSLKGLSAPLDSMVQSTVKAERAEAVKEGEQLALNPDPETIEKLENRGIFDLFSEERQRGFQTTMLQAKAIDYGMAFNSALRSEEGQAVLNGADPTAYNEFVKNVTTDFMEKHGIKQDSIDPVIFNEKFAAPILNLHNAGRLTVMSNIVKRDKEQTFINNKTIIGEQTQPLQSITWNTNQEQKDVLVGETANTIQTYINTHRPEITDRERLSAAIDKLSQQAFQTGNLAYLDVARKLKTTNGISVEDIDEHKKTLDDTVKKVASIQDQTEKAQHEVSKEVDEHTKLKKSILETEFIARVDEAHSLKDPKLKQEAYDAITKDAVLAGGDVLSKVNGRRNQLIQAENLSVREEKHTLDPHVDDQASLLVYGAKTTADRSKAREIIQDAMNHGQIGTKRGIELLKDLDRGEKKDEKEEKAKKPTGTSFSATKEILKQKLIVDGVDEKSPEMARYLARFDDRARITYNKNQDATEEQLLNAYGADVNGVLSSRKNDLNRKAEQLQSQQALEQQQVRTKQQEETQRATALPRLEQSTQIVNQLTQNGNVKVYSEEEISKKLKPLTIKDEDALKLATLSTSSKPGSVDEIYNILQSTMKDGSEAWKLAQSIYVMGHVNQIKEIQHKYKEELREQQLKKQYGIK